MKQANVPDIVGYLNQTQPHLLFVAKLANGRWGFAGRVGPELVGKTYASKGRAIGAAEKIGYYVDGIA